MLRDVVRVNKWFVDAFVCAEDHKRLANVCRSTIEIGGHQTGTARRLASYIIMFLSNIISDLQTVCQNIVHHLEGESKTIVNYSIEMIQAPCDSNRFDYYY